MEQSITDFAKDTFADFEHLHFGDDTETVHSDNIPEREPAMEDNNIYREDGAPWTESDLDLARTHSFTNTDVEVETKDCSENSKDGLLNEQSVKTGSMFYGSWDDNDSDEKQTQSQDQQLSLQEEFKEDEFEIDTGTSDIHQMKKEQAHIQVDDVSFLEMVPPEGTYNDQGTLRGGHQMVMEEMVDKPEDISSASEEDPVQSGDEMKEFTEDDHEREEEGLADYPSDLSLSENEGCSKSHKGETSTHMNTKLDEMHLQSDEEHCFHQTENQAITSRDDDTEREDGCMNPKDMVTIVKNELLDVEATSWKFKDDISFQTENDKKHLCVNYPLLNDSADEDDTGSSNSGEGGDSRTLENFQSIGQMARSSEGYMNTLPDYDSDISSEEDYSRSQDEERYPIAYTHKEEKNIAFNEEHTFTKDIVRDWNSIEYEEADMEDIDSLNPEICDAGGLSSIAAFPGTGMLDSRMEAYGTHSSENSNSTSELHVSGSNSVKSDQNNKEHNSEPSEVSNIGENINSLLPETFWNLMDEDNLKFDEYDWDVNGEEVICDEEDNFLEDLENEEEEEIKRDWEKEQERIEAFNRYYKSFEGEENVGRSHKVTFLVPESTQYEEEYSSSEEELSTNSYISELPAAGPSSVSTDQSNTEHNNKPSVVSDTGENIHTQLPETLWSSTLLMDEDNPKLDEYDHDVHGEDFYKLTNVICDENEHFLEELKNAGQEIKRDLEQEQAGTEVLNRYYEEFTLGEKNKVTDNSTFSLDQETSQNEEDNESSEQESNTEDDSSNMKTEDQSESDELQERRLYTGRPKVLPKGLKKPDEKLKKPKSQCLVVLRSVLAVSLTTVVGVLSYWWATDSMDWSY